MSRMSELSIEIQERLAEGQSVAEISRALNIPPHWVTEIRDEDEFIEYLSSQIQWAQDSADADAIAYGNF